MRLALTLAAGLLAASCASGPKPCTVEWVEARKDQVFGRFVERHQDQIASLLQVALKVEAAEDSGHTPALALEIASGAMVVAGLASDFVRTAVPEINDAVGRCGSPQDRARLFADLLRHQGVNKDTVQDIERLGLLEALTRL
jgi:hypothetical protein